MNIFGRTVLFFYIMILSGLKRKQNTNKERGSVYSLLEFLCVLCGFAYLIIARVYLFLIRNICY
jgi:hypothetical protein